MALLSHSELAMALGTMVEMEPRSRREVEEEEVHGGVEVVLTGCGCDDETIADDGSQVDAQEEPEGQELQLLCVCECQQEELGDGTAVGHLLFLVVRTLLKKRK